MASPTASTTVSESRRSGMVVVDRVITTRDREDFHRLPFRIYAGDRNWVPPLVAERRDFLDPQRNPFFAHAACELFLARRDGVPVGRIAAVEDRNFNRFQGTKTGIFGLYEAIDDDDVARALFEAARKWVHDRGLETILGPLNLSSNHDLGLLREGFDSPPAVMMPYNPRYYVRQFEEVLGLPKAKDLYAWWMWSTAPEPEKMVRISDKIREREGLVVRPLRFDDLAAEAARIKEIYNAAWEKNWGFVPLTDAEFAALVKELKQVAIPDLALLVEARGEPVAFSVTIPDLNQALIHVGGRLTRFGLPIGLAKLLWHSRKIDQLRLLLLGIKQPWRKRGLDAILCLDTMRTAKRLGFKGGEVSWTLEDNVLINRAIESMGGQRYKTYRVYETPVHPAGKK